MSTIKEWVSGNVFFRSIQLSLKDQETEVFNHNFDCTGLVFSGGVHVKAVLPNGTCVERDFGERTPFGRHFLIKTSVKHQFKALEDNTELYLIYPHRNAKGEIVETYTGWQEGYR